MKTDIDTTTLMLAQTLFRRLWDRHENVMVSPVSIAMALGMVMPGARGKTLEELRCILLAQDTDALKRYLTSLDGGPLTLANAAWVCESPASRLAGFNVRQEYSLQLVDGFRAMLRQLDFSLPSRAADAINAWVNDSTRGLIPTLVTASMFDDSTRMVLTNAAHFKGEWEQEFNPRDTQDATFYTPTGAVRVKRMMLEKQLMYGCDDDGLYVEIPYKERYVMGLLLSHDGAQPPWRFKRPDTVWKEDVILYMPKFRLSTELMLKDDLQDIGLRTLFTSNADLSGICDTEPLMVSDVIHRATIDVDEKGTEATAATAVLMITGSLRIPTVKQSRVINVDRPFAFTIIDRITGAILFVGKVTDPTS